jgi:hypothetical protein
MASTSRCLRASLHQGPFSWTMEDDLVPWSNFHGPIFSKNQFTQPLGHSLGVNQMLTKRNDHAPKVDVLIYLIYVQKGQF